MTSVVIVYAVIFLGIFAFTWSMFSRQKRLSEKLDELREELKDSSRK
jgi:CcmD family protein